MKKFYLQKILTYSFIGAIVLTISTDSIEVSLLESSRRGYEQLLQNHPFSQTPHYTESELRAIPKYDRPDLAWQQDYLATMDPSTGKPERQRLFPVLQQISQHNGGTATNAVPGSPTNTWTERGPNNVGGRTRAIMFDPNDATNKKVWAGGVTGGLWYNNDITDPLSTWVAVNDFWANMAITCITADPNNSQTFYVGTGEGWGTGSSRGAGIWKTTDGGSTWNQLSNTINYHYINDIAVRDEAGTSALYVASDTRHYNGIFHGTTGLFRSTNGGTSFTQVLPNVPSSAFPYSPADIEITSDNSRMFVGTRANEFGNGGGTILRSDDGINWTTALTQPSGGRVEIAVAPSDANYVYAMIEKNNELDIVMQSTSKGFGWTMKSEPNDADLDIPATDFSRGQAWYDLTLQVHPTNRDIVYAGAIDLFTSLDGAGTWTQISKWSNNNNLAALPVSEVHADQHNLIFRPGSTTDVLVANDGGVYYTNNIAAAGTSIVFSARNNGYNITQFYSCAIEQSVGSNIMLAGSQDNGTQRFTNAGVNSTVEVIGGDGGYCFADKSMLSFHVGSYTYNQFYKSSNAGVTFPDQILNDNATGLFINPAGYDNWQHVLYTSKTTSSIYRVKNVHTASPFTETVNIPGMTAYASHLKASPHPSGTSVLFVGTQSGELFKLQDAQNASPTITNIGDPSFPTGNISGIDIGATDNDIVVTFSNYGVTSVWYTSDGGANWVSKEGNLPDMPVRWVRFNLLNYNEVLLATEIGVWATTDFNSASPTWSASNSGLANVRVDMLDAQWNISAPPIVVAATHGRGLFSSSFTPAFVAPTPDFMASDSTICETNIITLTDLSTNGPTAWEWTITPGTVTFVNGTNFGSQNPDVRFDAAGTYDVKLKVTNATGSDSLTNVGFITVNAPLTPTVEISIPDSSICSGVNATFTASSTNEGSTPAYQWLVNGMNVGTNSNTFTSTTLADNDTVAVILTSSEECASPISVQSDSIVMSITPSVTPSVSIVADNNPVCATDSISFTATPVNGGTASYQWKINDTNVGSDTAVFKTNALADNDTVWVIMTSDIVCLTQDTAISDSVIVNINPLLPPSVSISTPDSSVCVGDNMTFTATPTLGGTTPSYQWTVNDVNVGTDSPMFTTSILNDNDTVRVIMTSSEACISDTTVMSDSIVVTIHTSLTPSVSISADDTTVCFMDNITFTASPINGGASPTYQWTVNGANVGSNSPTFSSSSLADNDTVTVIMTSSESCAMPLTDMADSIIVTINPLLPLGITISADDTTICQGTPVTFTATPTIGGASPTYQWSVNGTPTFSGNPFITSSLNNGDQVRVIMTSSEECTMAPSILSTPIVMSVSSTASPAVSISVSPNDTVCSADAVTFTATPINGGASPSYQWKLNGTNVGTNSPMYSPMSLASNDVVLVQITSSEACASTPTANSNAITMEVTPSTPAAVSITASSDSVCEGTSITFTATPTSGGLTPDYQWKLNGSNAGSNSPNFTTTVQKNSVITVEMVSSEVCADPAIAVSNQIQPYIYPLPLKPVITKTGLQLNSSVAAIGYQWFFNGNILPNDTLPSIAPVVSGAYTIRITDANGCTNISDPFNFVYNIGLNEFALNSSISLFPNPNKGLTKLLIDSEYSGEVSIMITDMLGNTINSSTLNKTTEQLEYNIDISTAASGMYFVQVLFNNTPVEIQKLIKE